MPSESLAQANRRYAYEQVQLWSNKPEAERQKLQAAVKGLGVSLRMQGLAVTAGTLYRDSGTRPLADALAEWLLEKTPRRVLPEPQKVKGGWTRRLLAALADADRASYQAAQSEALALAELLKVYAQVWNDAKEG